MQLYPKLVNESIHAEFYALGEFASLEHKQRTCGNYIVHAIREIKINPVCSLCSNIVVAVLM